MELFAKACQAVQHAQQKGVIHRDLKPSNMLMVGVDGQPIGKVLDFGLAKAWEETQSLSDHSNFTRVGQVLGTLKCMLPEQARLSADDVDSRTDVYTLGVILYELLTGAALPIGGCLCRGRTAMFGGSRKDSELDRQREVGACLAIAMNLRSGHSRVARGLGLERDLELLAEQDFSQGLFNPAFSPSGLFLVGRRWTVTDTGDCVPRMASRC